MIRAGWKVVAADGGEVGEVDEVAGDDTEDIFDGLAIATTSFGKPRYVPAEQVAGITQGVVRLSLTARGSRAAGRVSRAGDERGDRTRQQGWSWRDAGRRRTRGRSEG